MAIDLNGLATAQATASALSNLVLVTPKKNTGYQPQNSIGSDVFLDSLLFTYEEDNEATFESDITDHYTERQETIQDQIALKPEIVKVTGFIGEINDTVPEALQGIKTTVDKLTSLTAYLPELTEAALVNYNRAEFIYTSAKNIAEGAVRKYSSTGDRESTISGSGLTTGTNQNKQQVMLQQFYGYWRERRLFTVQTPWAIFKDMAIDTIKVSQDDNAFESKFEIQFKLMRFAETKTETLNSSNMSNRAKYQSSAPVNNGTNSLTSSVSLLEAIGL